MKVAVNEGRRLRRAELDRSLDYLVRFSWRVPESELVQPGKPLARLRHAKGHVRPSDRIEREIGTQPRLVKRSQELGKWAGKGSAPRAPADRRSR
jgi:hypothetical protein